MPHFYLKITSVSQLFQKQEKIIHQKKIPILHVKRRTFMNNFPIVLCTMVFL